MSWTSSSSTKVERANPWPMLPAFTIIDARYNGGESVVPRVRSRHFLHEPHYRSDGQLPVWNARDQER